jgi:HK97 family phage prohead protease
MKQLRAKAEVRAVNSQNLTVDLVASTFALDSFNTRIDPNGWDLGAFKSNPVICYGHDDRGLVAEGSGLPVARALPETARVEDNKLRMKVAFTPEDINPFGYKVFRMIDAGFISGVSVGFDPVEWEDHEEVVEGQNAIVRVYTKAKLMEVSIVTIPSNGEAMVQRAKQLNREDEVEQFRTLATEIEQEAKARTIDPEEHEKYKSYFERKQPANKASTGFLKKFYKARNQEPPQDEVKAWEQAEELIEEKPAPTPAPQTPPEAQIEPAQIVPKETPQEPVKEQPQPTTPPVPAAPEPERTASVQIPLSVLMEMSGHLARTYTDAAVEALRRGVPIKEVDSIIDGLNGAVSQSISTHIHGTQES